MSGRQTGWLTIDLPREPERELDVLSPSSKARPFAPPFLDELNDTQRLEFAEVPIDLLVVPTDGVCCLSDTLRVLVDDRDSER